MEVQLSINRKCFRIGRPDYFFLMLFEVFPKTETNSNYPGAASIIGTMRNKFIDFGNAHSAKKTTLADEIYEDILTETSHLIKYIENNCENNLPRLEETGFKANKTKGSPEPKTGKVINVHSMTLGGQKIKLEYESDDYAHYFLARVRIKGTEDWVMNGRSESHKLFITEGLLHGKDYEIQICGNGTKGQGDWSDIITVLVD